MYDVFLTREPFPVGMAATNRIISLAKGLIYVGRKCKVLIIAPTERPEKAYNHALKGTYEGVYFLYTSRKTIKATNKLIRLYDNFKGIINLIDYLSKNFKNIRVIYSTFDTFFISFILYIFKKKYKIKFIRLVDEYPLPLLFPEKYNKIYKYLFFKFFYHFFDGVVVMTQVLENYYKTIAPAKIKFIKIPMTVEPERFDKGYNSPFDFDYIAYSGNLGLNQKDGVDILIKAFGILKMKVKYSKIKLVLIGDTKERHEFKNLINLVKDLNLDNDVIFTGRIPRYEIPKYISNAKILALARPNNLQGKGGFPTKLGEYLMTGKPVVVTKVGEIARYLKHNESVFFAEPGNVTDFSTKLEYCLKNYNLAKKIGDNGKEIALENFDYHKQGKRLNLFIETL